MQLNSSKIDKIGEIIRSKQDSDDFFAAISILNDWRELHEPIMTKYYSKCQKLASRQRSGIIVSQRLKRLPTIVDKLSREPKMRLSSMQDIAGIRIVVKDMDELREIYRKISRWRHIERIRNYLEKPRESGYRGIHIIFKIGNKHVEVQLRTELQHLWATSVESADVFNGTAMKTEGGVGYWGDFFLLTSMAFARAEKTARLGAYEDKKYSEILTMLRHVVGEHRILNRMRSMALVDMIASDARFKKSYFVLMDLDYGAKKCNIVCFEKRYYKDAIREYEKLESCEDRGHNVVLVAVSSFNKLKDAYPNYFVDLEKFTAIIEFMLEISRKKDII